MTDLFLSGSEELGTASPQPPTFYEVFNPDHSVGVACDLDGEIIGLHIGAGVRDSTDGWLAAEILLLARLAYQKSLVGRRAEMLERGTPSYIAEDFGLPTAAQYAAMERAAFDQ
ncbi:hypothetical protein [Nocardia alni]|uniref:hypothetical protein n=1 Tax=Nocardia alni TaxID=2815723 RepID=UPI001C212197|nr:hypothetical protein [Nocardia alni]